MDKYGIEQYIDNENWEGLITALTLSEDDEITRLVFDKYNAKIPDDILVDLAINCYIWYGNTNEIIRKIIECAPRGMRVEEIPEEYVREGTITVYRGGCETIDNVSKMLSWSLSKETALYFYHKSGMKHLYQGTIKVNDIIAYAGEEREEQEILQYQSVYDIKEIGVEE